MESEELPRLLEVLLFQKYYCFRSITVSEVESLRKTASGKMVKYFRKYRIDEAYPYRLSMKVA